MAKFNAMTRLTMGEQLTIETDKDKRDIIRRLPQNSQHDHNLEARWAGLYIVPDISKPKRSLWDHVAHNTCQEYSTWFFIISL